MIGDTLLVLQKFERLLAAVLMTMTTAADANTKLRKALLRDKETLGRLMSHFADRPQGAIGVKIGLSGNSYLFAQRVTIAMQLAVIVWNGADPIQ